MAFRDDQDALRAKKEALEEALEEALAELVEARPRLELLAELEEEIRDREESERVEAPRPEPPALFWTELRRNVRDGAVVAGVTLGTIALCAVVDHWSSIVETVLAMVRG